MNGEPTFENRVKYNDLALRIFAAIIGAHIITEYGGDQPWLTRLFTKEYYIEFGASLAITLLVITIIYQVTRALDKKYNWTNKALQRSLLQILLGIILPSLFTFLLAALYFSLYGVNILDTNYHIYALPFIVALISIFNAYYLVRYLLAERNHYKAMHTTDNGLSTNGNIHTLLENTNGQLVKKEPITNFIVHTPTRSFPIATNEIAYFYRDGNHVFLRPFNGSKHILTQSLDNIEVDLDDSEFFRVARYMIVNYKAVLSYHSLEFGKLGLTLSPAFKDQVKVSKPLARNFKLWMKGQRLVK